MPELAIEAAALAGPYPERADDPRESADRQLWRGLGALAWSARRAARDGRRFLAQVGVAATGLDAADDAALAQRVTALRRAFALEGLAEPRVAQGFALVRELASRRLDDGRMVSSPLEDMAPFLSREELRENMIIG